MRNICLFLMFVVFSMKRKREEKLAPTSMSSSRELLSKNMLQLCGNFLKPESAQKMKATCKQWRNVKIFYENIFPNELQVAVFRNVNTSEILWDTIKFTELWKPIPRQRELVSHLRRIDNTKWDDVFEWFVLNWYVLIKNPRQNVPFLKKLMLAIAENAAITLTDPFYGVCPLMLASGIDDTDSILALIKKGADVNQQHNFGLPALHFAARYGSINACATLLENNANIDARNNFGDTPLMAAATKGKKNVFEFLIKKGANKNLINNYGKTASQLLADFEKR